MPTYLYWGEDDFTLSKAVQELQKKVLDPNWLQFNYEQIAGNQADSLFQALNLAMTPVFGMGERLIWLKETSIFQNCSDDLLKELQRTLPNIPLTSHLLFTTSKKPDGRLKSSKIVQDYAQIQEFSLIPPWQIEEITKQVQKIAQEIGVKLTPDALQFLAEAIGNNTRQIYQELEKLALYSQTVSKPLEKKDLTSLVNIATQSSLQLATTIRQGDGAKALLIISDLLNCNEVPLRIIATLVGQFRTWTIIKLYLEANEKDDTVIAKAAEINNPKRIYFLKKEVQSVSSHKLLTSLSILLDLELSLKRGAEPLATLQTKVLELCHLFKKS
ncbi:DNA polymerase III subunit delta [Aphanothece hegewaldii CCALA 016]|uniref:DNA polymerase III subunit delta n=1 Tax=Aphanothece hegewaldii CCALA 016 TaxID=2107694 RepID=A0A2T1LZN1_9CHRO|nr:DNA polymerase III subunit delta [Aphanothece hegewaldii]PSF37871.1 DNA polymerase III subunit delta [Aphanothece hegewaldii CCALA 016]